MKAQDVIRNSINATHGIVMSYLGDLTDAELLVRPVPGANHVAWQLGHLIRAEHEMVDKTCPGHMPPLPPGFGDKYTNDTANLDNAAAFHTKAEYLAALEAQRAGTLKALDTLSEADLDKPAPQPYQDFVKTVGELFNLQGFHWLMHAGQWAVLRRKLGRAPLF